MASDVVMPYGIDENSDAGKALINLCAEAEKRGYRVQRFQTNSKRNGFVLEGLHWVVTGSDNLYRYYDNPHDPKHSAVNDRIAAFSLSSLEYKCPRIFASSLRCMLENIKS